MEGSNTFVRTLTILLAVLMLLVYIFTSCRTDPVKEYIKEQDLSPADYPDSLIEMLRDNPETEDFVLSYPFEKDKIGDIDLSEYKNSETVPHFLQWDKRWGYRKYGDDMMAFTGCGPTCLSMVAVYLTGNTELHPLYIASHAERDGYYVEGVGTDWGIMTEMSERIGLSAKELPLDKNTVFGYLEAGKPIVCAMGPGDFTETGHFIVLAGAKDGKLVINDPNSISNSEKLWEFEAISSQIRNLWTFTKGR